MAWEFMFPVPPPWNSYVEILTPKVMGSGGGAFGGCLGHRGGDLMDGKQCPYKRDLAFSRMWHSEKAPSMHQKPNRLEPQS